MAKNRHNVPKYNRRPDAMKMEIARELDSKFETGVEANVKLASQHESKYSKKTTNKMNNVKKEYTNKNREK